MGEGGLMGFMQLFELSIRRNGANGPFLGQINRCYPTIFEVGLRLGVFWEKINQRSQVGYAAGEGGSVGPVRLFGWSNGQNNMNRKFLG